jgi:hypothetical protein
MIVATTRRLAATIQTHAPNLRVHLRKPHRLAPAGSGQKDAQSGFGKPIHRGIKPIKSENAGLRLQGRPRENSDGGRGDTGLVHQFDVFEQNLLLPLPLIGIVIRPVENGISGR